MVLLPSLHSHHFDSHPIFISLSLDWPSPYSSFAFQAFFAFKSPGSASATDTAGCGYFLDCKGLHLKCGWFGSAFLRFLIPFPWSRPWKSCSSFALLSALFNNFIGTPQTKFCAVISYRNSPSGSRRCAGGIPGLGSGTVLARSCPCESGRFL